MTYDPIKSFSKGIDAWFVNTPQVPTKDFPALFLTTVLLSPADDSQHQSIEVTLRGAFVTETVQYRRFEVENFFEDLENFLGHVPALTQVIVHASNDSHDKIMIQIADILNRVGAHLKILVANQANPDIANKFDGYIQATSDALALVALSAFKIFQGIDSPNQFIGLDVSDILEFFCNASEPVRLAEAFWLPAGGKLVFLNEQDDFCVKNSNALWVCIEGWMIKLNQTKEIFNSDTIKMGGRKLKIYSAMNLQYCPFDIFGSALRIRMLYR